MNRRISHALAMRSTITPLRVTHVAPDGDAAGWGFRLSFSSTPCARSSASEMCPAASSRPRASKTSRATAWSNRVRSRSTACPNRRRPASSLARTRRSVEASLFASAVIAVYSASLALRRRSSSDPSASPSSSSAWQTSASPPNRRISRASSPSRDRPSGLAGKKYTEFLSATAPN